MRRLILVFHAAVLLQPIPRRLRVNSKIRSRRVTRVRFAPKADKSLHRSEMTRCANRVTSHCGKTAGFFADPQRRLFDHLVGAAE
jgi:hypothetical protein